MCGISDAASYAIAYDAAAVADVTAALSTARAAAEKRQKTRESIGRLREKTLHATLKFFLDPDEGHHEVPLPEGPVADIFDGERVTEIQNGNFSALRPKLEVLLPRYPVTVVLPLPRQKTLVWIDPATGEELPPRRSPRTGRLSDALPSLIFIKNQLFHEHLTLRVQLLDVIEYRLRDGWGNDGRRGAHRLDRVPTAVGDAAVLSAPADLAALLPPLPETFTAAELGRSLKLTGRNLSAAINILYTFHAIERIGRQKNAYLYAPAKP